MDGHIGADGDVEFHEINAQIKRALDTIYEPRSSNEHRNEATIFLDEQKNKQDAVTRGVFLASNQNNTPVLRHYGLLLLEHTIKHKLNELGDERIVQLSSCVAELAHDTTGKDAVFLRKKIAQIWAELAEHIWIVAWPEMDKMLLQLWQKSPIHQGLVLHILETLSDEIFSTEDKSTALREPGLARACVEIVTPSAILSEESKHANDMSHLKSGPEGWYLRLLEQLRFSMDTATADQQETVLSILRVLRSLASWITRAAVARSESVHLFSRCLLSGDIHIQMASLEILHVIYHRRHVSSILVPELIGPLLSSQNITALIMMRKSAEVQSDSIDDTKYLFLKKFSEVMCGLGTIVLERPAEAISIADIKSFLEFTISILKDSSLVVSIPVLYLWTQLLGSHHILDEYLQPHIGVLLETCSQRTVRYEALPPEYEDDTTRFLDEDFEVLPEKHAFVGNYRRFCSEIVEKIVKKSPLDAMKHIIGQADGILRSIPEFEKGFDRSRYESQSLYYSQVEAQASVVTTAVKSYSSWIKEQRADTGRIDEAHEQLLQDLESWCNRLLHMDIKDPAVLRRLLTLVLDITLVAFSTQSRFPLIVCEQVLTYDLPEDSHSAPYGEALLELKYVSCRVVRKLATKSTDVFISVFPDFQTKIEEICERPNLDSRTKEDYKAILFSIVLRASSLSDQDRTVRLSNMLQPTVNKWRDEELTRALTNFESFCTMLGVDQTAQYLFDNKANDVHDWTTAHLDQQGQQLRDAMFDRAVALPLVDTRALIGASSDGIQVGSQANIFAKAQWREIIPVILPNLLHLLGHVHAFSNPEKWSSFPQEVQQIIQRSLVDRVWQSGISSETRDDFYSKVKGSKGTFEGLASGMRAAIRTVRELCYWILHCMAPFGDAFYGHRELAPALAHALYDDAHVLSSHQFSILLKLSTALLECCPAESSSYFLPPLLSGLFGQLDRKITSEWQAVEGQRDTTADEDALSQEMKNESIIRQLTNSSILLITTLTKTPDPANIHTLSPSHPAARRTALSNPQILEPLLLFLTHVLRMPDHRSCQNTIRILLGQLLPEYRYTPPPVQTSSPHLDTTNAFPNHNHSLPAPKLGIDPALSLHIRAFFSTEILKAAITSLHDGNFSDTHRDLAGLIGGILHACTPATLPDGQDTPRDILASLPNIDPVVLDGALADIRAEASERKQGRAVMSLLEGLRGVSIYEMGKLDAHRTPFGSSSRSGEKSGIAARYAAAPNGAASSGGGGMDVDARVERGGSPVEGSLNQLFG